MSAQLYLPGLHVGWGKYTASLRVTSSMQQETKYQLGLHPPNSSWVLRIYNDCGVYMESPSNYHKILAYVPST